MTYLVVFVFLYEGISANTLRSLFFMEWECCQLYKIVKAAWVVERFGSLSHCEEGGSQFEWRQDTVIGCHWWDFTRGVGRLMRAQNEKQSQSDDASLEMEETLSVKIRDISPFSLELLNERALLSWQNWMKNQNGRSIFWIVPKSWSTSKLISSLWLWFGPVFC